VESNILFKKKGVKEALAYRTFCKEHDNNIFQVIEDEAIDPHDYKAQCLLTYRSVVTEMRKKQIKKAHGKRLYGYVEKNRKLTKYERTILNDFLGDDNKNYDLGIKGLRKLARLLQYDIKGDSNEKNFRFYVFELPYYELAMISNFSFIEKCDEYFNEIFLHILPEGNRLVCIIGHPESCDSIYSEYVDHFLSIDSEEKLWYLTDILLTKVENWVMSESFYKEKISHRESYIKTILSSQFEYKMFKSIHKRLMINIFED